MGRLRRVNGLEDVRRGRYPLARSPRSVGYCRCLRATEFENHAVQAVAFTPEGGPAAARLSALIARWNDRFDGAPVVLPQVDLLPREVPRLVLSTLTGDWGFEAAPARISLTHGRASGTPTLAPQDLVEEIVRRVDDYRTFFELRVARLALVVTRAREHEDPGIELARHFCRPEWHDGPGDRAPLNRPAGFELHAHKRYAPPGLNEINSWIRIKTGRVVHAGGARSAVVVEQDMNQVDEGALGADLDREAIGRFFHVVVQEMDKVLRLYFPEAGG